MPKKPQSQMVTISNIWGVDTYKNQYGIRFRSENSATGWAKAFIPQGYGVQQKSVPTNPKLTTFVVHETIKAHVRFYDDEVHFHTEEMSIRKFKELYNQSRQLVKNDKVNNPDLTSQANAQREVPAVPLNVENPDDLPFE